MSLPDHPCHIRLRVCPGNPQEGALDGCLAVRDQPRGQPDLHANSVRIAELAVGCPRHPDRLGHNHLDDGGDLEALQMGCGGAGAVFRVGVDCDLIAVVDDLVELGAVMFDHEQYMRRAIELAGNVPELPFAAVIVDQDTGEVLSEGWDRSSINPAWQGEIDAINHMVEAGYDFEETTLALYTTAESCPMCQGAIHWCRPARRN